MRYYPNTHCKWIYLLCTCLFFFSFYTKANETTWNQITALERQLRATPPPDAANRTRIQAQLTTLYQQISQASTSNSDSLLDQNQLALCGLDGDINRLVQRARTISQEIQQLTQQLSRSNLSPTQRINIQSQIEDKIQRLMEIENESSRRLNQQRDPVNQTKVNTLPHYRKTYKSKKRWSVVNAAIGAGLVAACCTPYSAYCPGNYMQNRLLGILTALTTANGGGAATGVSAGVATRISCVGGLILIATGGVLRRGMQRTGEKCVKIGGTATCLDRSLTANTAGSTDVECTPEAVVPCEVNATQANCACDPQNPNPTTCQQFCAQHPTSRGCACADPNSSECCLFQNPDNPSQCVDARCQSNARHTNCPCSDPNSNTCMSWCQQYPNAEGCACIHNPHSDNCRQSCFNHPDPTSVPECTCSLESSRYSPQCQQFCTQIPHQNRNLDCTCMITPDHPRCTYGCQRDSRQAVCSCINDPTSVTCLNQCAQHQSMPNCFCANDPSSPQCVQWCRQNPQTPGCACVVDVESESCQNLCRTQPESIGCACRQNKNSQACCLMKSAGDPNSCYAKQCQTDATLPNCPCTDLTSLSCKGWCKAHPNSQGCACLKNPNSALCKKQCQGQTDRAECACASNSSSKACHAFCRKNSSNHFCRCLTAPEDPECTVYVPHSENGSYSENQSSSSASFAPMGSSDSNSPINQDSSVQNNHSGNRSNDPTTPSDQNPNLPSSSVGNASGTNSTGGSSLDSPSLSESELSNSVSSNDLGFQTKGRGQSRSRSTGNTSWYPNSLKRNFRNMLNRKKTVNNQMLQYKTDKIGTFNDSIFDMISKGYQSHHQKNAINQK